jgi:hypothetical protein
MLFSLHPDDMKTANVNASNRNAYDVLGVFVGIARQSAAEVLFHPHHSTFEDSHVPSNFTGNL